MHFNELHVIKCCKQWYSSYPKKKIINFPYVQEDSNFSSENILGIILLSINAVKTMKIEKNIFKNNIYLDLGVFQAAMT